MSQGVSQGVSQGMKIAKRARKGALFLGEHVAVWRTHVAALGEPIVDTLPRAATQDGAPEYVVRTLERLADDLRAAAWAL